MNLATSGRAAERQIAQVGKRRPWGTVFAAAGLAMAGSDLACAQVQFPPVTVGVARQVSLTGQDWRESAIGASQINENEVVVLCYAGNYVVTLNGGSSFTRGLFQGQIGDPFVACGPGSGTIWAGGVDPGPRVGRLSFKLPGETTLLNPVIVPCDINDKPSMCIGPIPGDPATLRHHLMFNLHIGVNAPCAVPIGSGAFTDAFIESPASVDDIPLGFQPVWTKHRVKSDTTPATDCHYEGFGITGVVLDDGTVVAAARDAKHSDDTFKYNQGRPYVVRSVDGGFHWMPDFNIPIKLVGVPPIQANLIASGPIPGDTAFGIDARQSAPSIARDPNTDWVYVAFTARSEPNPGSIEGNSDLYIFRSKNKGQTFLDNEYVHLTDAMLGIPVGQVSAKGPDQVKPAIAIDCQGGVNSVYYDGRNDLAGDPYTNEMVDVYYSRITDFKLPSMAVTTTRFTPTSIKAVGFGDYMTMTSAGPSARVLYSAYEVSVPNGQGGWSSAPSCFLRKITMNLCALSESGNFTAGDASSILSAIAEGAPEGDILQDGAVDIDDLELLLYWCQSAGVSP